VLLEQNNDIVRNQFSPEERMSRNQKTTVEISFAPRCQQARGYLPARSTWRNRHERPSHWKCLI